MFFNLRVDILDSGGQQLPEVLILKRNTGGFRTIGTTDLLQPAENHIRIVDEILIHLQPVFICTEMHPRRLLDRHCIALLEEDDIRGHLRASRCFEGVVWKANRANQISALGKVSTYIGILFIQRAFRCDKCDDAAGANLVQCPCEEVVMDQKVVLVIPLVHDLEVSKRHVANGNIKKTVRKLRFLEALDSNGCGLVQLLCDATGDGIQLHAVNTGI